MVMPYIRPGLGELRMIQSAGMCGEYFEYQIADKKMKML